MKERSFLICSSHREKMLLYYKQSRNKVILTEPQIIAVDFQGLTGKKKQFRMFPNTKIINYSVETAETFDWDSGLTIWVSGVGAFAVKLGKR